MGEEHFIGCVVLYHTATEDRPELNNNSRGLLPAIITAIHGSDVVNLQVFANAVHGSFLMTSVARGHMPGQWDIIYNWPEEFQVYSE